jgi:hypothetical protein
MRATHWIEWTVLGNELVADGWKTPHSYANHFADIEDIPAVYMFVLIDTPFYELALPAYVGMSTRLLQRVSRHPMKAQIQTPDALTQTWFKPAPKCDLRRIEADYIKKYDPKWNIVGRRRGEVLS